MQEFGSLEHIVEELKRIKEKGYIPTRRKGPTGVGHTLEQEFGLSENNLIVPDLGEIELKSSRSNATNLITLFTADRGAWQIPQKEAIQKYGNTQPDSRVNLYQTLSSEEASNGLRQSVIGEQVVVLGHNENVVASWSIKSLTKRFHEKIRHLIIVYADSKLVDGTEYFWFNDARFCTGWLFEREVPRLINETIVRIDLRLHLKGSVVRNHGTGFRISTLLLPELYPIAEPLL